MIKIRITQRDGRMTEVNSDAYDVLSDLARYLHAEAKPMVQGCDGKFYIIQMRNIAMITLEQV